MTSKWTSRKLWMSVITIIVLNVVAYLGKPELEEQLLDQASVILDAILTMIGLLGSAAVTVTYVMSEANIDATKVIKGSAPTK